MSDQYTIDAISGISSPDEIRVVLFINNRLVHAPLPSLVQSLTDRIEALEAQVSDLDSRVTALESP